LEKNFLSGNVKFPFAQAKVALREGWGEQKNKTSLQSKLINAEATALTNN